MSHRFMFDAVSKTPCDSVTLTNDRPFGSVVTLLAGDFRHARLSSRSESSLSLSGLPPHSLITYT